MKEMNEDRNRRSRRGRRGLAVLAMAVGAMGVGSPQSARADDFWNTSVTNSDWNTAGNWQSGIPTSSSGVVRITSNFSSETVLLDVTPPTLTALAIGSTTNDGVDTLNQTLNFNINVGFEVIGGLGAVGSGVHTQSAGTNTYTSYLDVANDGGIGVYYLQNTGKIILTGTGGGQENLVVGDEGDGTFNQSGGTITSSVPLYLGYETGGVGGFHPGSGGTSTFGTTGSKPKPLHRLRRNHHRHLHDEQQRRYVHAHRQRQRLCGRW